MKVVIVIVNIEHFILLMLYFHFTGCCCVSIIICYFNDFVLHIHVLSTELVSLSVGF